MKKKSNLMEYSDGVRPYILEWLNEVFLIEYNDKQYTDNSDETDGIGLTTKELVNATLRIKGSKFSTQQIYENYLVPLINAGYIDRVDNKKRQTLLSLLPRFKCKTKNYSM